MKLLAAHGLSKGFQFHQEKIQIFSNLEFICEAGETISISGASGSGKSTLLSILSGMEIPDTGEVLFLGKNIFTQSPAERRQYLRENISFIFQNFDLVHFCTARENVALPLEIRGERDAFSQAEKMLEQVGLGDRFHHYPDQLSGGEKQRVAVARALIHRPKIVFADEPTGNLDEVTAKVVTDLLFMLCREYDSALILVTHNPELARRTDRSLHLAQGVLRA